MSHRAAKSDRVESSPGSGRKVPATDRTSAGLERLTLIHVGAFLLLASWGFGGNAPWSRAAMAWWGTLGAGLTIIVLRARHAGGAGPWRPLLGLAPCLLFNGLVLASLANPSFRELTMGRETLLEKIGGLPGLPSSARPALTRDALWLFDGIYLSCFNLLLAVRRRRALRGLLLLAGTNALILAVFGSLQKLSGATGLYFGLVRSPQNYFFASFIYHNHWGAFTVLMTALCLGLVTYYSRRREYRDFWHSPAFAGLVAVFFLAASIPLSNSRSCTLLVLVLLGGAFLHWTSGLLRERRATRRSIGPPLAAATIAVLLAAGAAYQLAQPVIEARVAKTREQFEEMRARGSIGSRLTLYRDTWHMGRDRLLFGWGMGSYPMVFHNFYNTQDSPVDHLPVFYQDAHSDWLQSIAEVGLIGTALLGLHGLVPLLALRRRGAGGVLPVFLLAGCTLILIYAGVEFPFGNPAVVLAWWLCFFTALRYAGLEAREEKR